MYLISSLQRSPFVAIKSLSRTHTRPAATDSYCPLSPSPPLGQNLSPPKTYCGSEREHVTRLYDEAARRKRGNLRNFSKKVLGARDHPLNSGMRKPNMEKTGNLTNWKPNMKIRKPNMENRKPNIKINLAKLAYLKVIGMGVYKKSQRTGRNCSRRARTSPD